MSSRILFSLAAVFCSSSAFRARLSFHLVPAILTACIMGLVTSTCDTPLQAEIYIYWAGLLTRDHTDPVYPDCTVFYW